VGVRALAVFLLLASLAAGDDVDVPRLLRMLDSDVLEDRDWASRRLRDMGEAVIPALKAFRPTSPESARRVRSLLRNSLTLRLDLQMRAQHPLGATITLDVRLINNTYDTYIVPLVRQSKSGHGTLSTFLYALKDGKRRTLTPDKIEWEDQGDNAVQLFPGKALRARITLDRDECPIREPGRYEFRAAFFCRQMQRLPGGGAPHAGVDVLEVMRADFVSRTCIVIAKGSTPAQLETALRGADAPKRALAIAEISVRKDAPILGILRHHADDPDIRLSAIRRLGAAAQLQDLDLIRKATADPQPTVRNAAVLALANFQHRKARSKLIALTWELELRTAAVRALTKHKHPATIDCFVRLLRQNFHEGAWVPPLLHALYDWTDRLVPNRASEIAAFERWWRKNRDTWTRKNLTRK